MKFTEWIDENWEGDNMLPPPIEPQIALNFLEQYLLGEDWYSVNPITSAQANVEIVHAILYKNSPKYRKEFNKYKKSRRQYNESNSKIK